MERLVLLAAALCALLPTAHSGRVRGWIVGGREARAHSRPYMASLQIMGQSFCGGALIQRRWVLTAAHCMDDTPVDEVRVVLGADNLRAPDRSVQMFRVQASVTHPEYNPNTFQGDILLLKLNGSARVSPSVRTLSLPRAGSDVTPGSRCSVAGWGDVSDFGTSPRTLMETDVDIISRVACNVSWGGGISNRMLCAASPEARVRGFCSGDSGGPLVCGRSVEGVVSFSGLRCGNPLFPDVYTHVAAFLQWIQSVMARKQ